jgi:hypothetical protein
MTPIVAPLPEHRCPLCGGPNACAAAEAGRFDVPCWCAQVRFEPTLLARVPAEQQGRACVCRACAEAAQDRTSREGSQA